MNKFNITLSAYHELTQVVPSLPISYAIAKNQIALTNGLVLSRTPGTADGSEISLMSQLKIDLLNVDDDIIRVSATHIFN